MVRAGEIAKEEIAASVALALSTGSHADAADGAVGRSSVRVSVSMLGPPLRTSNTGGSKRQGKTDQGLMIEEDAVSASGGDNAGDGLGVQMSMSAGAAGEVVV